MARDYKKEYERYQGTPTQIKMRAERNHARLVLEKAGLAHPGDNRDVDHIKPLVKGGSNNRGNLRVVSPHANRSFRRTSKAGMK